MESLSGRDKVTIVPGGVWLVRVIWGNVGESAPSPADDRKNACTAASAITTPEHTEASTMDRRAGRKVASGRRRLYMADVSLIIRPRTVPPIDI